MGVFHDHGDVVRYQTAYNSFTLFNHPKDIREILSDHNFVRMDLTKSVLGSGLLTSDGPLWERQRRLLLPDFQPQCAKSWTNLFAETVTKHIATWKDHSPSVPVNLSREMERLTLSAIGKTLFGCHIEDRFLDAFTVTMKEIGNIGNAGGFGFPLRRQPTSHREFQLAMTIVEETVAGILSQHKHSGNENSKLLSRMTGGKNCPADSAVSADQVRDEVVTMLTAGNETTAVTLGWAWYCIASHPHVADKLYAEVDHVLGERTVEFADISRLKYTRMVIDETLRLYPPVWIVSRKAERDANIRGTEIPAESGVMVSPFVVHRHPDFWNTPEKFSPERFAESAASLDAYAYFPFIAGRHRCLGQHFALTELVVATATIAQQFRFELCGEPSVEFEPLVSLRSRNGIWVRMQERHHSSKPAANQTLDN